MRSLAATISLYQMTCESQISHGQTRRHQSSSERSSLQWHENRLQRARSWANSRPSPYTPISHLSRWMKHRSGLSLFKALPGNLNSLLWTKFLGRNSTTATVMEDISEMVRQQMRGKWLPLHSACYIWNKTFLPNMLLTNLGDRTEMSHSVEGRVPFLDHHLMEYVNGLPPSLKFRYDPASKTLTEKWILKEASKPFITKELYERKKHVSISPNEQNNNSYQSQMISGGWNKFSLNEKSHYSSTSPTHHPSHMPSMDLCTRFCTG